MTTATLPRVGWSSTAHPDRMYIHKLARTQRGPFTQALCGAWVKNVGERPPPTYWPCPTCYGRKR